MQTRSATNLLLTVIAALMLALLVRPLVAPKQVAAQTSQAYPLAFDPGVFMLRAPDNSRQVFGRIAIDTRSGVVWGFPTTTQDPYPVNPVETKPQTSHPFVLGRFAVEDTAR